MAAMKFNLKKVRNPVVRQRKKPEALAHAHLEGALARVSLHVGDETAGGRNLSFSSI